MSTVTQPRTHQTLEQPAGIGRPTSPLDAVLDNSQASRALVQDLCPLAESVAWELGQEYLRAHGNRSFLSDATPVPWYVNNDSTLSRNAAEVFYESLERREESRRQETIYVLEVGVGVGLFARFFLDRFKELCRQNGRDYYDRLCYIAADRSERMLRDMTRHGVLAEHAGHYRLRVVDAMDPAKVVKDLMFACRTDCQSVRASGEGPAPEEDGLAIRPTGARSPRVLAGVFLNYLLDCLPAAVLEVGREEIRQLCVRTVLGRNVALSQHTDMSLAQVQEKAKSGDAKVRWELLPIYGFFASEYAYKPLEMRNDERGMMNDERGEVSIPHLDFALEVGRKLDGRVLHSYGAIQALERLLDLVEDGGFILLNDYGQTEMTGQEEFEHQRFSLATFVGVNFPLLKEYFAGGSPLASRLSPLDFVEPFGEAGGIHSRLLGRGLHHNVKGVFQERFGEAAHKKREAPIIRAREYQKVGASEIAVTWYRQAMAMQPANWVLMNEAAQCYTFGLPDPKTGANIARLALEQNPACSSELWCTLGDALYQLGRNAEAGAAYLRALEINESDVRARFNLSWVYLRDRDYDAALDMIAQALARDKTGEYRERLLQKQQEVLAGLAQKNAQEYLLRVNLVSTKPEAEIRNSNIEIRNKSENRNSND